MCHNLFQNSFYALSDFLNFKTICRLQEHMEKKMQKLDNKKKREETRGQLERNNHSSKKFIVQVLHLEKIITSKQVLEYPQQR